MHAHMHTHMYIHNHAHMYTCAHTCTCPYTHMHTNKCTRTRMPAHAAGEWLRRGLLAERLCHDADALLAYRACIKTGGFNLVALTAIMRLAVHSGEALEVFTGAVWCACTHACMLACACLQLHGHAHVCVCGCMSLLVHVSVHA